MALPHVYTKILAPIEAKRLYHYLSKPQDPAVWSDEGGASREVKLKDVSRSDLLKIELPKFCSSFDVTVADSSVQRPIAKLPPSFFLGGDDWMPPEYGEGSLGTLLIVIPELNFPIKVTFSKASGDRFFGKVHNCHFDISVSYPSKNSYLFTYCAGGLNFGDRPPFDVQRAYIDGFLKRFDFPRRDTPGVIEGKWDTILGEPGASVEMTPESCDWFEGRLQSMLKQLIEESSSDNYLLYMNVSVGGNCQYRSDERCNVREIAVDLLERIARENDFEHYKIRYSEVGPLTWQQIAKTKRKIKEPTVAQLGTLTLEDGTIGNVSMTTHENGFQFFVEFSELQALHNFFESELYKQTAWSFIDH